MESALFNTDFDIQYLLKNHESLILSFDSENRYSDINEIITLYKIKKAFDFNVLVPEWDDDKYNSLKEISKKFCRPIGIFFSTINCDALITYVSNIDITNQSAFWELFSDLKLYKKISALEMENVLQLPQDDRSEDLGTRYVGRYEHELHVRLL